MTRAPVDHIPAPEFPRMGRWIGTPALRMADLCGRPVLVEFWDFCRVSSLRTLPYVQAWHARYADAGLAVIGAHAAGFPPGGSGTAVAAAVARLRIEYPVFVDARLELWREYENLGWPARYLFGPDGMLHSYHFGEGAYAETETEIQSLLGLADRPEPLTPRRPEEAPDALLAVQSDDIVLDGGPWSGAYEAGEVWAVLSGTGFVHANGVALEVTHPGAYRLVHHDVSTRGTLTLELGDGVECHGISFSPGLAPV